MQLQVVCVSENGSSNSERASVIGRIRSNGGYFRIEFCSTARLLLLDFAHFEGCRIEQLKRYLMAQYIKRTLLVVVAVAIVALVALPETSVPLGGLFSMPIVSAQQNSPSDQLWETTNPSTAAVRNEAAEPNKDPPAATRRTPSSAKEEDVSRWAAWSATAIDANKAGLNMSYFAASSCPDDDLWLPRWLTLRQQKDRGQLPIRFVDVGANKGYTMAGFADAVIQRTGSGRQRVTAFHKLNLNHKLTAFHSFHNTYMFCGLCCDCTYEPAAENDDSKHDAVKISIVGFEGNPHSAKRLQEFFSGKKYAERFPSNVNFTIVPNPVSSRSQKIEYVSGPPGKETSGIATPSKTARKTVSLQAVSLDEYFADLLKSPTEMIDYLTTDTEGHDPKVFLGAQRLLQANKIGIYQFELAAPEVENFGQLDELQTKFNFKCYLPMQYSRNPATRRLPYVPAVLSYDVYQALPRKSFGLSGWMNAICFHRTLNAELISWMDKLTKDPSKEVSSRICELELGLVCMTQNYMNREFTGSGSHKLRTEFRSLYVKKYFNNGTLPKREPSVKMSPVESHFYKKSFKRTEADCSKYVLAERKSHA